MRITLIGTGNVATILGRMFVKCGHEVVSVYGRSYDRSAALANELNAAPMNLYEFQHQNNTDLYIIAVTDSALQDTILHLQFEKTPVVHTAGAVSRDILQANAIHYGVFYPLQTLTKESHDIPEIPFLIDANSDSLKDMLIQLAHSIHSNVYFADDNDRLKLHVAAVFVNNFTNHLFGMADHFCKEENVPFAMLKPLIMETAARVQNFPPSMVQTGPAARKDITTLDKHLRILNTHPKLRTMYLRMTDSIMNP